MLTVRDRFEIWFKGLQFGSAIPDWAYRYIWPTGNPFICGFHRQRAIFVHIPKSAGTSIANALFGAPAGHRPIRRHLAYQPALVDKYFKFTFVRNPWDRLYSAYNYFSLHVGSDKHRDHRWASTALSGVESFEDFILRLKNPDYAAMIKRYDHFREQVDWLTHPTSGEFLVDFIGRFEMLEADFLHVRSRLGADVSLPHQRKGAGNCYRQQYHPEMVKIVRAVYSRDVTRLGYEFL